MTTKERIITRVNQINDPQLLEDILRAVDLELNLEESYQLTELESAAVAEGLKDANEGKLYSQSEAREFVRQWQRK